MCEEMEWQRSATAQEDAEVILGPNPNSYMGSLTSSRDKHRVLPPKAGSTNSHCLHHPQPGGATAGVEDVKKLHSDGRNVQNNYGV